MNKNKIDGLSLKERLTNAGCEVKRIEIDGRFCGVAIYKNGVKTHEKPRASYGFGLSLCGFFNT